MYKDKNTPGPSNVIVRFVNRKRAKQAIENRKLLKERVPEFKNLFIVENLCPKYRSIFEKCKKLKQEGKIKYLWSRNGIVNFKKSDNRHERPKKICDMNDYYYHFPEPDE